MKVYPLELLEVLAGQVEDGIAYIHTMLPIEQEATKDSVEVNGDFHHTLKFVEGLGMKFIGTIHSHTEIADTSPSKADRVSAIEDKEMVSGIVAIHVIKGRRRTHTDFYAPAAIVELEVKRG